MHRVDGPLTAASGPLPEAFCLCLHGVLCMLSAHEPPGLRKDGLTGSEIKV